ncbi:molybdopterin-dependent oxidoreductase [Agreia sp. VKM Ac-1783]|uniref:molybdopterin-dependent oxidoreductase n=1 Tax=Agreia sp. VKM Ac-1783 TaxID=1938889 RepID=UPI000A2AEA53|nr:molybdopterin-dependent oxidoreductase [Agreia sp. VKM Ac-1783]SMQ74242.1 cytochrome b561 [Agreia sp. VKM Ac-1783]
MRRLLAYTQQALSAPPRNPRMAVVIGRLLAIAFLLCFGTGLYSHFLQEPEPWMRFSTVPAQLYQVTQGIHIAAGIACFPLILGKLYTIYPQLFQTPPVKSPLHLLERASIALFVGASLVQITIGLLNTYQWYPWKFGFREVHWALSFVVIGSLAIHIAVKLPMIARFWTRNSEGTRELRGETAGGETSGETAPDAAAPVAESAPVGGITGRIFRWIDGAPSAEPAVSRRGFVTAVGVSTATVVALTAGQSFAALSPFNIFAPRVKGTGPNALPVNRTAKAAQVLDTAVSPDWALTISNGPRTVSLTRAELLALPQTTVELPISCVEGWSQMATWKGVRLRELLNKVGADTAQGLKLTSLEKKGGYRVTQMGPEYAFDASTLVALEVNGDTLDIDHGYPARMIAPGRPGVLQTKWLSKLEVEA